MPRRTVVAALAVALAIPTIAFTAAPAEAATDHVVINEAYLNGGSSGATYTSKYVELYNPSNTAVSVDGWSVQYRSSKGGSGGAAALTGTIPAKGYYVLKGSSNGSAGADWTGAVAPDATTSISWSGSTGTLVLADQSAVLDPGAGSVTNSPHVIDLVGYGSAYTYETSAAPSPSVSTALARTNGADTDNNAVDISAVGSFAPTNSAGQTYGSSDPQPSPDPTPDPTPQPSTTTISDIQGTGASSPLAGQTVTTTGFVTAAYPTGGFKGYVIQSAGSGSALDDSSDAIFVYSSATVAEVSIGDYVQVTGTVSEYNGLTELSVASGNMTKLDAAGQTAPVPAKVTWPATDAAREALEDMLIEPQGDFTVTDTYKTNQYGSVGLASGTTPLMIPTEVGRPGSSAYAATVADNAARGVVLDDGATTNFFTAANQSIPLPYLSLDKPVRVGAAVTFTKPVIVDYRYSAWNFQPVQELTGDNAGSVQPATFANTRSAAPKSVGGRISVSSFNVLNYFTTTGEDANKMGAGCSFYTDRAGEPTTVKSCSGTPAVRGAANAANLARQQAKIVAAINAQAADVLSLEEIENSAIAGKKRDAALATLVDALNSAAGTTRWAYVPSPSSVPSGEDVIRTAFIYNPDKVELVGNSVISTDSAFDKARYPLAQAFRPVGEPSNTFLAITNHFKSKGSCPSSTSDPNADSGDGQGCWNALRTTEAQALVSFANTMKTTANTDKVFLLGDLNSYTKEDPMQVLADAGYVDQGAKTGKYTYSFGSQSGSLDHILANPAADALITGADIWDINSGESVALEYSRYNYNAANLYDESPYRSSDHDPVIVGFAPAAPGPVKTVALLNFNDFHGRIEPTATVQFAGTIEAERTKFGDANTLLLSTGDSIGASLFASATQGDQPTIDVLNALGVKASAVGNHEFDKGFTDLTDRVIGNPKNAQWDYLGANVYAKGTTNPALPEYALYEVNGVTVGVVGVVTDEVKSLVSPGGIATLDFGDEVEAVNRVATQLKDGNDTNGEADVVVAEYHDGANLSAPKTLTEAKADSVDFAKMVDSTNAKVDVIFNGHTHASYAWQDGNRAIVQAASYGTAIGEVVLDVNTTTGDVTTTSAKVIKRTTEAADALSTAYPRAAQVKTITDAALAHAAEVGNQPVGKLSADITTAFTGSYVDGKWVGTKRDDRSKASTLGNLVANSLVESLKDPARGGADIGIMNPGGLRAELTYAQSGTEGDGVITYAEANSVLPFVNNLWTTTLTGAQFKQVLEEQWQPEGSSRAYLQLSLSDNVRYTFDPDAAKGHHITNVWVNDKLVTDADTYRVGSASFLIQGGDNFTTFAQGTNTRDSGLLDYEAWIDYLKAHQPVAPNFAKQGVAFTAATTGTVGESYTMKVSDLNLTSVGSPANTSLEVRVGDTLVTTVPVTNGAAEATITIPNTGAVTLTALPTKTTITVPVTIKPAVEQPAVVTHTTLTLSKRSVRYGTSVTATAAVTGASAGRVVFEVSGRKLTATLRGGMARVTLPNDLPAGKHWVKASFVATDAAAASSARPVKLTVSKAKVTPRNTKLTRTVKAHKAFSFTVATKALGKGVWATGTVKVYLHGHLVATTKLTKADHGSKRITISAAKLRWYGRGSTVTAVAKLAGSKNTTGATLKVVRLHLK